MNFLKGFRTEVKIILVLVILAILIVGGIFTYLSFGANQEIESGERIDSSGLNVSISCAQKISVQPCEVGGVIVQTVEGSEIARQTASSDGVVFIPLQPGRYLTIPMAGTSDYPVINFEPRQVEVSEGMVTEISLQYSDGRR